MSIGVLNVIKKSKVAVLSAVFAVSVIGAGIVTLSAPSSAAAAACDDVNIIHCGLDGSSINGYINSLQKEYANDSDNGHHDINNTMKWAGATTSSIGAMTRSNTKIGTLYKNGDIKVGGDAVGQDAWVSARFTDGDGFTKISDGVWARKTTTSFAQDSAPVIVHFGANGEADFAVMVDCGNAVKFTPIPKPKPQLSCTYLRATAGTVSRRYNFTVRGNATNTTISNFAIDFGDGTNTTIRTTSETPPAFTHDYPADGKSYKAVATVYSSDGTSDTNANCAVTITTPTPVAGLVCTLLTQEPVSGQKLTYKFIATATAQNTTIKNYVFTYSDGTSDTIATSNLTASASHIFPSNSTTYITSVAVSSDSKSGVTSDACKVSITTPAVDECKPGVPTGSAECNTTPPTTLVSTGMGGGTIAGVFAVVAIGAAMIHRYLTRIRYKYLV